MLYQLSDSGIKAPTVFMNYLKNEIFKDYIDNGICRFMLFTFNFIECDCKIFDSIPYISFFIDEYEYKLHKENFVLKLPKTCKLDIVDNYFDNTTWEFNINFIKEFPLLFNYTDSSITFVYDSNFYDNIKFIFFILILLCVIGISINICIKFINIKI